MKYIDNIYFEAKNYFGINGKVNIEISTSDTALFIDLELNFFTQITPIAIREFYYKTQKYIRYTEDWTSTMINTQQSNFITLIFYINKED